MFKAQSSKVRNLIWIFFALAIIVVYFFGLNLPLLGPDEPRYAQVAREMFARGDWITPTLGGFDWFEKPALLYWLQIISYHIFGVGEFAARFGSAVFGLGTIISLWILGRKCSGVNNQQTRDNNQPQGETGNSDFILQPSTFAAWLAVIAASSIGMLVFSHAASFDIILTFPLTASLVGFFIFDQSPRKKSLSAYFALAVFYFFIGVALIGKGLVGVIFPFAIVGFYQLLKWEKPARTFVLSLLWGTILSLLVAALWYVPMYRANGWKFIDEFIIQHHFQRFTSDKYQHHQPFLYFFLVLPLMTIPWLPFFLAAVWNFLKAQFLNFKNARPKRFFPFPPVSSPLLVFAFAWLLVPLVFFSLSGSKLPGYILPSLPAALILTAEYVVRFVCNNPRRRLILLSLAAAMFIFTIITLQFFAVRWTRDETVKDLIAAADAQGFSQAKILNLYTISHNAEFYGANRLARAADGKQKYFDNAGALYAEIAAENKPVIVLVPLDGVKYLTESSVMNAKVLADNGGLAIVAVEKK